MYDGFARRIPIVLQSYLGVEWTYSSPHNLGHWAKGI
jgi:hypothetical protein